MDKGKVKLGGLDEREKMVSEERVRRERVRFGGRWVGVVVGVGLGESLGVG